MHKKIAILPWDWIWEEVVKQAIRVLDKIAEKFGHEFEYKKWYIWWAWWDNHWNHFPKETEEICKNSDAILFWSVWWPVQSQWEEKWKNCEANSILALRKTFQFNANFRPVSVHKNLSHICPLKDEIISQWIDMLIMRELVWDIYFWEHKTFEENWEKVATDEARYTESQIEAIAHTAFQAAQKRWKKVTSVDKANVLDVSKLWREVVTEVAEKYPDIELEHMLVDNAAMQIIKNPASFDVLLTWNIFWDILSDAAAVLPWSLWLMPSASLNKEWFWLYEPSGWSAPDIAWMWIANPIAQILSAAMMLKFSFWMKEEAGCIENAVNKTLEDWYRTWEIWRKWDKKVWTEEMGDEIIKRL